MDSTVKWWDLESHERDELVAGHVLKWKKIDNHWFAPNSDGSLDGPKTLLSFTTDEDIAWELLKKFDNWQVTKMFPLTYRVFISTTKNNGLSKSLPEAICLAALRFCGVNFGKYT